jgi:transcriptional regulator with XRE-family HTH domain
MMIHDEQHNPLQYRKRMGFTQFQAARLLGWKNIKGLGRIESGQVLPTLKTAFKLAIIYRVPLEFLFKAFYVELREQLRAREAALVPIGQQVLPFPNPNTDEFEPITPSLLINHAQE